MKARSLPIYLLAILLLAPLAAAGQNVGLGRDYTIFATEEGQVKFHKKAGGRTYISVVPGE